jgi:hypothetical protein
MHGGAGATRCRRNDNTTIQIQRRMASPHKRKRSKNAPQPLTFAPLPELPSPERRDILFAALPVLLFLSQCVYFLLASPYARTDFPLDDAWIHQVYARSFAHGDGFAYNPGEQEAGSTSPLWAIATAPAHWLGGFGVNTVVMAVKVIGILFGFMGLFFAQRLATRLSSSKIIGMLTAMVFLFEPRFVFSALSGMEVILVFALLMCGIEAMLAKRWLAASVCFGLAPTARPEALLFLPVYALFVYLMRSQVPTRRKALVWIIPAIPMAIWMLFCLSVNGHLLPNTYYMKASRIAMTAESISVSLTIMLQSGLLHTGLPLLGIPAFVIWVLRRLPAHAIWPIPMFVVLPVVFALIVASTRHCEVGSYYWSRWIDPAALLLSFGTASGLSLLFGAALERARFTQTFRVFKSRPVMLYVAAGIGVVGFAASMPSMLSTCEDRRFHLWSDSRSINIMNVQPGKWIDQHVPGHATVGVNDAGAIRYFGNRYVVDLKGLNYADFAFQRVSQRDVIRKTDWIAVFPAWFTDSDLLSYYDERASFKIPLIEYTICDCPANTHKWIGEKKKEFRNM